MYAAEHYKVESFIMISTDNFIRISYSTSMHKIEEGVKRLESAFGKLKSVQE